MGGDEVKGKDLNLNSDFNMHMIFQISENCYCAKHDSKNNSLTPPVTLHAKSTDEELSAQLMLTAWATFLAVASNQKDTYTELGRFRNSVQSLALDTLKSGD